MMEPVILPRQAFDEIIAHAREGKPEEICGVLRGRGLEAFEAIRGKNVASDRVNNYDVDPQTLLLQFKFEEAGDEMMGIYHSHPISVAYPSATDAWNAHYPESIYLICSLEFDDAPVMRAFRMVTYFMEASFPDVDVNSLQQSIATHEIRPGSRVFAFFQDESQDLPRELVPIAAKVAPPFYVEFHVDRAAGEVDEARVVTVYEHLLHVV